MADKTLLIKAMCENNPFARFLGLEAEECGDGYARLRLPFRQEFVHSLGVVQGGITTGLADSACAYALGSLVLPRKGYLSIELKINFLASNRDEDMIAEGRVVKVGGRVALCEADVKTAGGGGKHLARCSNTFLLMEIGRSGTVGSGSAG